MSFKDDLMTIGTGMGRVFFYDVRARDFLESLVHDRQQAVLKLGTCVPVSIDIIYVTHVNFIFVFKLTSVSQ